MKYLGIDYGVKKIGVAITDEMGKFAFPLIIIQNKKSEESLKEVLNILREKNINKVVIGESKDLAGRDNYILKEVKEFSEKLKSLYEEKYQKELEIYFEKE